MIKIFQKTNRLCFFVAIVVLVVFLAGCKRDSQNDAQTDEPCVLRISKGCVEADKDEDGQTSDTEASEYYGSQLEENRQRLEDHNFAMMRKYDTNKNGKLEKREQSEYRAFRANLLSQSKAGSSPALSVQTDKTYTPRISKSCIRADADEDGQICEEEAATYFGSRLEEKRLKVARHNLFMMQHYDTNNDGMLEKRELGEYLQTRADLVQRITEMDD